MLLVGKWDLRPAKRLHESSPGSQDVETCIAKRQCVREQQFSQESNSPDGASASGGPPRTLVLEYWDRTDECLERKWAHMDMVDSLFASREELILATTLNNRETVLEPNMFPYDTPKYVEHWTLWSRHEMDDAEIEQYVCGWLAKNAPDVESWNDDENLSRSIDIFHVHVYLKRQPQLSEGN